MPSPDILGVSPALATALRLIVTSYSGNNLMVAAVATLGWLLCIVLAVYLFARCQRCRARGLWAVFLALLVLPNAAYVALLVVGFANFPVAGTVWASITLAAAGGKLFCVQALRSFMTAIPDDLLAAAEIEGASRFTRFRYAVLPGSGVILGSLASLLFLDTWNDLLISSLALQPQVRFAEFSLAGLALMIIFLAAARSISQRGRPLRL